MGVVNNQQIVEAEQRATLLVNPRLSHEEYVKYSFPSKTSEYMLSGTPLLTTKLGGIPDEYFQYVYVFADETVKGFAQTMEEILSYPENEIEQKGKAAQNFILNNKNNIIQSKRVVDLFIQTIKKL
jgi:glycosyltransferase involved in cell wall biosynthesis